MEGYEEKGSMKSSSETIETFLKGIDYPASKEDIIDHAKSMSAPDDIIRVLNRLPDRQYQFLNDVEREVNKVT